MHIHVFIFNLGAILRLLPGVARLGRGESQIHAQARRHHEEVGGRDGRFPSWSAQLARLQSVLPSPGGDEAVIGSNTDTASTSAPNARHDPARKFAASLARPSRAGDSKRTA